MSIGITIPLIVISIFASFYFCHDVDMRDVLNGHTRKRKHENTHGLERGMFEQPQDFIKDAQGFKCQEIRVKLKRMYFVVRPCKPVKN